MADDNRLVAARRAAEIAAAARLGYDVQSFEVGWDVATAYVRAAIEEAQREGAYVVGYQMPDNLAVNAAVGVPLGVSSEVEHGAYIPEDGGPNPPRPTIRDGGFVLRGVLSRNASDEWTEAEADEATDAILDFFKAQGWQYGGLIGVGRDSEGRESEWVAQYRRSAELAASITAEAERKLIAAETALRRIAEYTPLDDRMDQHARLMREIARRGAGQ